MIQSVRHVPQFRFNDMLAVYMIRWHDGVGLINSAAGTRNPPKSVRALCVIQRALKPHHLASRVATPPPHSSSYMSTVAESLAVQFSLVATFLVITSQQQQQHYSSRFLMDVWWYYVNEITPSEASGCYAWDSRLMWMESSHRQQLLISSSRYYCFMVADFFSC